MVVTITSKLVYAYERKDARSIAYMCIRVDRHRAPIMHVAIVNGLFRAAGFQGFTPGMTARNPAVLHALRRHFTCACDINIDYARLHNYVLRRFSIGDDAPCPG